MSAPLPASAEPRVTSIDEAIARMEIDAGLPATDGLACFNRMYLAVTRRIRPAAALVPRRRGSNTTACSASPPTTCSWRALEDDALTAKLADDLVASVLDRPEPARPWGAGDEHDPARRARSRLDQMTRQATRR